MVSSGLKSRGYEFVNLDDCWLTKGRDAKGDLQVDKRAFPDGLEPVIKHVHGLVRTRTVALRLYLSTSTSTSSIPKKQRSRSWALAPPLPPFLLSLHCEETCG